MSNYTEAQTFDEIKAAARADCARAGVAYKDSENFWHAAPGVDLKVEARPSGAPAVKAPESSPVRLTQGETEYISSLRSSPEVQDALRNIVATASVPRAPLTMAEVEEKFRRGEMSTDEYVTLRGE